MSLPHPQRHLRRFNSRLARYAKHARMRVKHGACHGRKPSHSCPRHAPHVGSPWSRDGAAIAMAAFPPCGSHWPIRSSWQRAKPSRSAASGDDPRNSREANLKRGMANAEHHRRNHEWSREHGKGKRDDAWFQREIVPKLIAHPLNAIARATRLSLTACSRIRSGSQTPHPRHWDALAALVKPESSTSKRT